VTLSTYTEPIVDLFAGPGGWDEGATMIGATNTYGLEFEANACRTAEAAGHARFLGDIAAVEPTDYRPCVGLIASPPCQAWSKAGKQLGRLDKDAVFRLVQAYAAGEPGITHEWADPRSHLVAEPMRWTVALEPEWIVLEEVPSVLPLWDLYADLLEERGYSTWHGVLNAADYGVPQTRKRAILIASRTRKVGRPAPTHGKDAGLFAPVPWQTMAEALGWDGVVGFPCRSDGAAEVVIEGTAYRARDLNATAHPAQVVTEKARSWLRMGANANATVRSVEEPAPTVFTGHQAGNITWHHDDPRATQEGSEWTHERPATTVVGSFRPDVIAAPGWRKPGDGPRQNTPGSVKVEVWEAGVLQSFRPDYPWQGARTRQFQQVGNAVPPRLAAHVIAEAIGIDPTPGIAAYYAKARAALESTA
jgi:DNA (cytosine-5)-methyltransferase 1